MFRKPARVRVFVLIFSGLLWSLTGPLWAKEGPYMQELKIQDILARNESDDLGPVAPSAYTVKGARAFLNLRKAASYEKKNISLMLHYLTVAGESEGADLAGFWIDVYRARAYLSLGDYARASSALRQLVTRKNLSPERQTELRGMYLHSLRREGQSDRYLAWFREFTKGAGKKSPFEEHYWHAAEIAESTGKHWLMLENLEHLIRSYPIGVWSRKAFKKLISLSCEDQKGKSYHFSYRSLTLLGRNASIDKSLADLLVAFSTQKIRWPNGSIRAPDPFERIDFLAEARLNQVAYDEGLDLLRTLPAKLSPGERRQKNELLILLGKLANRLYRHNEAVKYFSITRSDLRALGDQIRVSEYLADSLSYGGFKEDASGLYGNIARQTNKELLRWHHFWSRYSSDDMEQARSLISSDKNNKYVPPRDYLQPHGPRYWKARVLENLSRGEEARKEYLDILNHYPDDIYSNFIALRHPGLSIQGEKKSDSRKNPLPQNPEIWSSENLMPETLGDIRHYSEDIRPFLLLYQAGLWGDIRRDISGLASQVRPAKELAVISILSGEAGAHHVQFKFAKQYILKTMPGSQNWFEITANQNVYNQAWRAYYPVAYKDLITEVTEALGVDPWFMLSVMRSESYYQEKARSFVGARGLMQIMPYTAVQIARRLNHSEFELSQLWDHRTNLVYGAWYLKILLDLYNNNPLLTAAAYNAGPFAVNAWTQRCKNCELDEFVESIPYKETRRYVKNILRSYARYQRIYTGRQNLNFAFEIPAILTPKEGLF